MLDEAYMLIIKANKKNIDKMLFAKAYILHSKIAH